VRHAARGSGTICSAVAGILFFVACNPPSGPPPSTGASGGPSDRAPASPLTTLAAPTNPGAVTGDTMRVLCDGDVFDGYRDRPFVLDGGVDADVRVLKVIRNCTFRNSSSSAIMLRNARNVLIENNRFENIRTRIPGEDVSAINIPGAGHARDITIQGNTFDAIGSDGIHVADAGRNVTNLVIDGNRFAGSEDVGENAVDVKGADGPITIRNNTWSGFRPCETEPRSARRDCSGSNGAGLVVHDGRFSGRARNVTIVGNTAIDNTRGLVIDKADRVWVTENVFRDSLEVHLYVEDVTECVLAGNSFRGRGTPVVAESACAGEDGDAGGDG
jgi:nitrous oxidase accessory protein NosD